MTPDFCRYESVDGIATITIDRPEVYNALHVPAAKELSGLFDRFFADPACRVAMLTGTGDKAFCAGNDLKHQAKGNSIVWPPTGFGGLTARFDRPKPVIAAVNGLAAGGGFELVLACDMAVAVDTAFFALPETRVGLMAAAGGLLRLPRQVPEKIATEVVLAGRRLTAQEGLDYGLLNRVVSAGDLLPAARTLAEQVCLGSPRAVRASMEIMRRGLAGADPQVLYAAQKSLPVARALYDSADAVEGPRAFAEKRAPNWEPDGGES